MSSDEAGDFGLSDDFNLDDFLRGDDANHSRYERRIAELQSEGIDTTSIELAVAGAIDNLKLNATRSFVIYGEPQSGKTEMMIALTACLLDAGHRIVVVLLNDSVQLLEQNLDRFLRSGLDPAPKKFSEILDPSIKIGTSPWVIFCKKNSRDLQKLLSKIEHHEAKVVIDDEADYASPNAKINRDEVTKINELVGTLLQKDGIYIGVTATPARLDLNNTFDNDNERWVDFPPHSKYTGQSVFFPTRAEDFEKLGFRLELLPNEGDDPKYLRRAFFGFLVSVAYLNTQVNSHTCNYSMLIHTSGKRVDHTKDFQQITGLLSALKDNSAAAFERYVREIYAIAAERHPGLEKLLTRYVVDHINQSDVVVMNSNTERNAAQYRRATSPATLFTIAIGGNIVSRGVTFDDLLCMFFTRDVKHKIQQDTYIQRARMFGSRGVYLSHFELHIPESLYLDWQKCFVFHRLAISAIRTGRGSPVWLENKRIAAVAASSIDQAAVGIDSGEMSWEMFDYPTEADSILADDAKGQGDKLRSLASLLGDDAFPSHVLDFIDGLSLGDDSIAVHPTTTLGPEYGTETERTEIRRVKGFIAGNALERKRFPRAIHHVKIFRNSLGRARLFYKYTPEADSIRFLKNRRIR
jgi:Z1 domain-containing protein/type III restriction/modification enzyme restriction subunit